MISPLPIYGDIDPPNLERRYISLIKSYPSLKAIKKCLFTTQTCRTFTYNKSHENLANLSQINDRDGMDRDTQTGVPHNVGVRLPLCVPL